MIASLVVTLDPNSSFFDETIERISGYEGIQLGEVVDGKRLPITIESSNKHTMDATNQRILDLDAVISTEIVFVHFGDDSSGDSQ